MQSSNDLIPFNDLSRSSSETAAAVEAAIARVVASGWYVMGPEHNAFEAELASYLGVRESVLVGNGTDALELALAAVGVGEGDLVLGVANAGAYATIAARLLGATMVYADVSPETLLMTPATLREALDRSPERPAAIVVTHLYGLMADMLGILAIAEAEGIVVVEDCAQSIGASLDGRKAGAFGRIATTSFYPTKNLGALGDGGAVYTDDPELAASVRRMRQYGWASKYHIGYDHGRNSRLDELQAAILRAKLPLLDGWNERRRSIHSRYVEASSRMVGRAADSFIAHLAVLTVDDRDAARESFAAAGVSTDVHYPVPDHRQAFPSKKPSPVSLPVTERVADQILSVPMFPELTDNEVDRVAAAIASLGDRG